jgi:hypothetical protein
MQVGSQAADDRYTDLPSFSIFLFAGAGLRSYALNSPAEKHNRFRSLVILSKHMIRCMEKLHSPDIS